MAWIAEFLERVGIARRLSFLWPNPIHEAHQSARANYPRTLTHKFSRIWEVMRREATGYRIQTATGKRQMLCIGPQVSGVDARLVNRNTSGLQHRDSEVAGDDRCPACCQCLRHMAAAGSKIQHSLD